MNKVYTMEDALQLVHSGDTLACSCFGMAAFCEEMLIALEKRFLETGEPRNLTAISASGNGDWNGAGWDHLAHEGLLKRIICAFFSADIRIGELINDNKIEAYNLPQGIIVDLYRDLMRGYKGELTKVGLQTFVDPRLGGGRLNKKTVEDLVHVTSFEGEEWLYYDAPRIDVAFIRGTTADKNGDISIEHECLPADIKLVAMATKACGGKVIAQVKYLADTLTSDCVEVPGIFVDAVVVSQEPMKYHRQAGKVYYKPSMSGHINVPLDSIPAAKLDEKKVISRRAAMELEPKSVINLGIGIPEGVSLVANEEGLINNLVMTTESGAIAGVALGGTEFGAVQNAWAVADQCTQFDFYDGGGLDVTFLGLAQVDMKGNVNVSKFGSKIAGCGGFINITQQTHKIVYCGTFTASGLRTEVGNGTLKILQEGKRKKFITDVEQISFSGIYAAQNGQSVLYITERAVFKLTLDGLELIEIAPGIDLEKDILALMDFKPIISENLKLMDERIFKDEPMGLHF